MANDGVLEKLRQATIYAISEPTDDKTDIDILEQIHADVISRGQFKWSQSIDETKQCLRRKSRAIDYAHQRGMLFVGGVTVSALYLQNSNGTTLLSSEELAAMATRSAANELVDLGGYHHGCINNPLYIGYVKNYVHVIIDGGVDGIHFDEADSRWFHHRPYECFCDHCNEGLIAWLRERYTDLDLADRYGIQDISTFSYREYLAQHGWAECPGRSPLHHEWWLFQLKACQRKFAELLDDAQTYAEEHVGHRLVNTANVYDPLWLPERCLEAPYVDYVMIGSCLELRFRRNGIFTQENRLPPLYSYAPMHLATRSCTPDRPVTFFIDWPRGADFMSRQTPQMQRDLLKYLFAESYACGVYFHAPYKSCYARWTGPIDMLTRYTTFFAHERACYGRAHPVASVGVLYSYASSIWDHFPMELAPSATEPIHWLQYYGVGQALIDAGISFDSIFVGDGRILEDCLDTEQLARYEVIVVPCWHSVSPRQITLLQEFASGGGKLLIVGAFASSDTERNPQTHSHIEEALGSVGAHFLRGCDYEEYLADPTDLAKRSLLAAHIEDLAGRPLRTNTGGAGVEVLLTQGDDHSTLYVHLINRELTPEGFIGKTNLPVAIPLPRGITVCDQAAQLSSPDTTPPMLVNARQTEQGVEFVLPTIDVYGLIKLSCVTQYA